MQVPLSFVIFIARTNTTCSYNDEWEFYLALYFAVWAWIYLFYWSINWSQKRNKAQAVSAKASGEGLYCF